MAKTKRIIKNGYVAVVKDNLLSTATILDYEYEHRVIAEELLDNSVKKWCVSYEIELGNRRGHWMKTTKLIS